MTGAKISTFLLAVLCLIASACNNKETTIIHQTTPNVQEVSQSEDQTPNSGTTLEFDESSPSLFAGQVHNEAMITSRRVLPKTDSSFIDYSFTYNQDKNLNGSLYEKGTRNFVLKGKSIDLSLEKNTKLINLLDRKLDIKTLVIEADEFKLDSKIHLPQTHIIIKARKLEITPRGQIITTPIDQRPSVAYNPSLKRGENGLDGLRSGDIEIYTQELLIHQRSDFAFDQTGGNGQDAGPGRNGTNGLSVHNYGSGRINECKRYLEDCPGDRGCRPRAYWSCAEHANWPQNGEDAHPAGQPGNAGINGNFISNKKINTNLINQSFGQKGKKGADTQGGKAGSPRVALLFTPHNSTIIERERRYTHDGGNAIAPALEPISLESGFVQFVEFEMQTAWVSEGMIQNTIKYADELFLNQNTEALSEYLLAKNAIELIPVKEKNPLIQTLENKLHQQLTKIYYNLDYFGHELTWIPKLSFEANYSLFKKELNLATKLYSFSHWILSANDKLEEKKEALTEVQETLFNDTQNMLQEHLRLNQKLPQLQLERDNLLQSELYVQNEIKLVLQRIEDQARRNVISENQKRKLKRIVKSAAAVASVIPIGQPAFSAIGTSLNILTDGIDLDDPFATAQTLYKSYKNFSNGSKLEVSSKQWNQHWSQIKRYRDWEELSQEDKNKVWSELKSFSTPILEQMTNEFMSWRNYQQPANEVEREIEQIKSEDLIFQNLSQMLSKLVKQRQQLHQQIQDYILRRGQIESQSLSNLNTISRLQEKSSMLASINNDFVIDELRQIKKSSQDRLLSYHYKMAKAFEYRTLKPYPNGLDIQHVWNSIDDLIKHDVDEKIDLADLEHIQSYFTATLQETINSAVEMTQSRSARLARKTIPLSLAQINSLNHDRTVYITLDQTLYGTDKNDIRITNVEFLNIDIASSSSDNRADSLELIAEHDGRNYLNNGNKIYLFQLDTNSTKPWRWITQYDTSFHAVHHHTLATSDQSLLAVLLDSTSQQQIMMFARPGGLTQLSLKLNRFTNNEMTLDSADLVIYYEYR